MIVVRFPHPSRTAARSPAPPKVVSEPSVEAILEEGVEEAYDDEQDHDRCVDCKGSGWYVGLHERRYCPTCDGSGYL